MEEEQELQQKNSEQEKLNQEETQEQNSEELVQESNQEQQETVEIPSTPDTPEELENRVESILFAAGRVVLLEEVAGLCNSDKNKVKKALEDVSKKHKERNSPLLVVEEGEGWKVTVREVYLPFVHKIVPSTELSKTILETLSVIAWKQPVVQSEVVDIRSNKAYDHVSELVDLGFISKERQGRSYVLKTTKKFAEYFDLHTIEDIKKTFNPVAEKVKLQQKAQAEAEEEVEKLKIEGLEVVNIDSKKSKEENENNGDEHHIKLDGMEIYEKESSENVEKSEEKVTDVEQEGSEDSKEKVVEEKEDESHKEEINPVEENTQELSEQQEVEQEGSEDSKEEPMEKLGETEEIEKDGQFSLDNIEKKAAEEFKEDIKKAKKENDLSEEEKAEKEGKGVEVKETGRKVNPELEEMIVINEDAKEILEGKKDDGTPKEEDIVHAAKEYEDMEKLEEEEQKKEGMLIKEEGEED